MNFVKPSILSLAVLTLLGCSSNTKTYTQADIDLLIERVKVEERQRISRELDRQAEQKRVFASILARQNSQNKANDKEAEEAGSQSEITAGKPESFHTEQSNQVTKIIPQSRKPVLYKEIAGIPYMRCAANSLVPIKAGGNAWTYKPKQQELSATLCKRSRDKSTMLALQQKLYDMKLLFSDVLTKEQLVDGLWGESTLEAVKKYQSMHGLLFGQMTIETLEHIGVFKTESTQDSMLGLKEIHAIDIQESPESGETVDLDVKDNVEQVTQLESKTTPEVSMSEDSVNESTVTEDVVSTETEERVVIQKIIPTSRASVFYQSVGGANYYRCAANSLVPVMNKEGKWSYSQSKQELSATLCKKSRDMATMTDLQYELYEKGYLKSDLLSKDQLVSGNWNKATLEAVKTYQAENGLLYGQLTIEMLEHLGIFEANEERVLKGSTVAKNKHEIKAVEVAEEAAEIEIVANKPALKANSVSASMPLAIDANPDLELSFTPVKVSFVNPKFDASKDYPKSKNPELYATDGEKSILMCRARAELATVSEEGGISYTGEKAFRATLCKASRSEKILKQLQIALRDQGFLKPSPPLDLVVVDGVWGLNTFSALKAYQKANGLAYGQVTLESFESLGVFVD